MTEKRKKRTGSKPVRQYSIIFGAVASCVAAPLLSAPADAAVATVAIPRGQDVDDFYKVWQGRPLWFEAGHPTAAAQAAIALLSTANIDGLDPQSYRLDAIRDALRDAGKGDKHAVRKADRLLSEGFAAYARDLRSYPTTSLQYVDPALRLGPPSPLLLLEMAARSPSLKQFVADMEWMSPTYAPLRRALVSGNYSDSRQRDLLRLNLERSLILPTGQRYIIVNAASQRLYMYDDDRLVDSMKVVVGQERPDRKTPTMAGLLHYASLNPYWNVPPDLAWDDVGKFVDEYGLSYLETRGYQILSDWSDNATVVDPGTVDWKGVKDGSVEVRIRQLPGPENFLGKIKYTFSNPFGVYLHDTIRRELLEKDTRLYSGGCIRLEDAARLGKWLFGRTLTATSDAPDIKVPLKTPVPVFVVYMTAVPSGSSITYFDDVYGWDEKGLANLASSGGEVAAR